MNEEPFVTEAELARVVELDAKATQGPYAVYEHEDHRGICIGPPYRESWMKGKGDPGFRTDDVCRISGGRRDGVTEQQRHDAAAIAEYRTLCPRIARELAAARAAITELEHSLEIALKGKRPFTPKLADEVISGQVKQITKLQDELAAIREWTPAMEYNDPTSRFHLKAWRLRTASGKPVWEQPPTAALTQLNTHTHE